MSGYPASPRNKSANLAIGGSVRREFRSATKEMTPQPADHKGANLSFGYAGANAHSIIGRVTPQHDFFPFALIVDA